MKIENKNIQVEISQNIIELYPEIGIGYFTVEGMNIVQNGLSRLLPLLVNAAEIEVSNSGFDEQNILTAPHIAMWRSAVQRAGLKPSTFRSSVEQLQRRLLRRELSTPLAAVSAYCAISGGTGAPLGGYDLDKLDATKVLLRMAIQGDQFSPLGGHPDRFPLNGRIPVYAIDSLVICWMFNVRDSSVTCLSHDTTRAIFIGESISKSEHAKLLSALGRLSDAFRECGGLVDNIRFISASLD